MGKQKVTPIKTRKPLEWVVRVGDLIEDAFSVVDYGTDAQGRFAIIERADADNFATATPVFGGMYVKAIGDDTLTLDPNAPDRADEFIEDIVAAETAVGFAPMPAEPEPHAPKPLSQPVRETLKVNLTKPEINARALRAAKLQERIAKVKAEAKVAAAIYKQDAKALNDEVSKLVDAANSGTEYQEIEAVRHFDIALRQTWVVYRADEYDRRDMTRLEMGEFSLFGAVQMPSKVDVEASTVSTGEDLAKKAADHDAKKTKEKRAKKDKPEKVTIESTATNSGNDAEKETV